MRASLKYGWNTRRVIYTLIGAVIVIRFFLDKEWIGMLLGGYFFAMGLFGFGCAGGNCAAPRETTAPSDSGYPAVLKDDGD